MPFLCLYVPYFPVQAVLRSLPEPDRIVLSRKPVALVDGPDSLPRVFACNPCADQVGIHVGMTKVQAEHYPAAIIRRRSCALEATAQSALLDCAAQFTPRLESTAPGAVILDLTGTEALFGSSQMLAKRFAKTAEHAGFDANLAVAENPDTSQIAARGFAGITVIPARREAEQLACLPLDVLLPESEIMQVLDAWGIRTCKDLASLPATALVERLGQRALHFQKLAQGETNRVLVPAEPHLKFEEVFEFEDAVENLEALGFVLNRLLEQIGTRLTARSLAAAAIQIDLRLEAHQDRQISATPTLTQSLTYSRRLTLPVPVQDTKLLLKLLQLDLAAHPPHASVKAVILTADHSKPRLTQTGLFAPLAPEPEKLELTLARARAVVGETDNQGRGRIGSPLLVDCSKPDSFMVVPFKAATSEERRRTHSSCAALRIFRPALPAKVQCVNRVPTTVWCERFSAKLTGVAGPWRVSGEWWNSAEKWSREAWDVAIECEQLAVFRIYRDLDEGKWFIEGMYD